MFEALTARFQSATAKTITVTPDQFRQAAPATEEQIRQVDAAIKSSQEFLLGEQQPEGYWIGELYVDVTLISDFVIFMHWRGEVDFDKQAKIVKSIFDRQQADGGWATYVGGPSELNATVKAYFALKLAGISPEDTAMKRAQIGRAHV